MGSQNLMALSAELLVHVLQYELLGPWQAEDSQTGLQLFAGAVRRDDYDLQHVSSIENAVEGLRNFELPALR